MKYKRKTKKQLIDELEKLRQRITDLERPEIDIKQAKDGLSIVYDAIDSTVGGIIITDLEGRITYLNPSFLRLFGYTDKSQLLEKNAAQLFPGEEIKTFCDLKSIIDKTSGDTDEFSVQDKAGKIFTVEISSSIVKNSEGAAVGRMASFVDITKRKQLELEKENLILKLQDALNKIKTLRGLIPICAACKNIRDDKGYWHQVEEYIRDHSEAQFSHGICPECSKKLYPEVYPMG
jgi:PAS domain S-box-containing protein